jgi:hypothetical protein
MANDQDPKPTTQSEQNEPVFVIGMIGIVNELRPLVREDGFGLVEGDSMLLLVSNRLSLIPGKVKLAHGRSVTTM